MTCLEIKFLLDVRKFIIYAIYSYRLPNNNIDIYLTELENDILTRAINQNAHYTIIVDDINIDTLSLSHDIIK